MVLTPSARLIVNWEIEKKKIIAINPNFSTQIQSIKKLHTNHQILRTF